MISELWGELSHPWTTLTNTETQKKSKREVERRKNRGACGSADGSWNSIGSPETASASQSF